MARIIPLTASGDPTPVVGQAILYSKDDGGVVKSYIIWDDGTIVEIGSGGGGIPVAHNVLVFRPGSAQTGPVVFDDFNDLYAQLEILRSASQGIYTILFDDTDASPVNLNSGPGNTTYDFSSVRLVGIHQDANVDLEVGDDGGEGDSLVINNALWFEGLNVTTGSATDTPFKALGGETITLKRTKWTGDGEYVYDFLTASGTIHLDDESALEEGANPAIRVNNGEVTLHVNGAAVVVTENALVTGVGGTLVVDINSSSARVSGVQGFLAASMTFNMKAASGFWEDDPNTVLSASQGVQVCDPSTGIVWRNHDGSEGWAREPFGVSNYVTLDTATEKTIFTTELPSVAEGAAYAVDFNFKLPQPVSGSQGVSFAIESGDANITYYSISEGGTNNANRHYSGRVVITFGPVSGPNQNVMRSGSRIWIDADDESFENKIDSNGPELFATPLDQTLRVFVTIDLAADTGEEQQAHASITRLA